MKEKLKFPEFDKALRRIERLDKIITWVVGLGMFAVLIWFITYAVRTHLTITKILQGG